MQDGLSLLPFNRMRHIGRSKSLLTKDSSKYILSHAVSLRAAFQRREDMWRALRSFLPTMQLDYTVPLSHDILLNSTRGGRRQYIVPPEFSNMVDNPHPNKIWYNIRIWILCVFRALSSWESAGRLFHLVTQNVDKLHTKAGSKSVTELHGCTHRIVCLNCDHVSL